MKNKKKIKIAAYLRVSTKKQADSQLGIEAQERHINNWINYNYNKKEYNLQITYFKDEGISGSKIERPEFQKMLNLIVQEYFDVCVIYKIDRLSRDVGIASDFKEKIKKSNCSLVSISENFDLTTIEGTFVYNIQSVFGEHERELIRKRTVDSQISKLLRGEYPHPMVYGYSRKGNKAIIDNEKAEIVRFIFDAFERYRCYSQVIKQLNIKYGMRFSYNRVSKILNRIEYTGKVEKKGVFYENIFPRIISDEQYYIAQNLRKTIIRVKREDHYRYQNRIICNSCKAFCSKDSAVKNKCKKYFYYHCPKCKKYINVNKIEKQLEKLLDLEEKIRVDEKLIQSIKAKLHYYNSKLDILSSDFIDEHIDLDQYTNLQKIIQEKTKELNIELLKNSNISYKDAGPIERKALIERTVDKIFVDFEHKNIVEIIYLKQKK